MGLNYAPRMRFGIGTGGALNVTIDDQGRLVFPGDVDFSPELFIEPGNPNNPDEAFPPNLATLQPGAIADAEWSSLVVTPAGNVFNVQQVYNSTGVHDRAFGFADDLSTVELQLLDGFEGGAAVLLSLGHRCLGSGPRGHRVGGLRSAPCEPTGLWLDASRFAVCTSWLFPERERPQRPDFRGTPGLRPGPSSTVPSSPSPLTHLGSRRRPPDRSLGGF